MSTPRSESRFLTQLEPLLDPLYTYARRAAFPADAAGDLVQEAVMIAWREYPRFQPGTSFRRWTFRILVNLVWKHNKRALRGRPLEEAGEPADLVAAIEQEESWGVLVRDAERLGELLDQRLAAALAALDPQARQCLLLRWLEEFSYREIAEMMRLPAGTVMSHVHRARAQLRERLAVLALERGMDVESGS